MSCTFIIPAALSFGNKGKPRLKATGDINEPAVKEAALDILAILIILLVGASLLFLILAARWAARAQAASQWLQRWQERRLQRLSRERK
jgi:hypothetical protein